MAKIIEQVLTTKSARSTNGLAQAIASVSSAGIPWLA